MIPAGVPKAVIGLLTVAAVFIIIAGLREARDLVSPLLLAVFIALILYPVLRWQVNIGVPRVLALVATMTFLILVGFFLIVFLSKSIEGFTERVPFYQERLETLLIQSLAYVQANIYPDFDPESLRGAFGISAFYGLASDTFSRLAGLFNRALLILLVVLLILERSLDFFPKLQTALGMGTSGTAGVNRFHSSLQRYLKVKLIISLITGFLATLLLGFLGVDFYLLWGFVAFILNFIPTIGSILAGVPAVLTALIQLGPISAFWVLVGYFTINIVLGSLIEPRVLGHHLGVSALTIFCSLILWGWVLGPIGMLLAVPITMSVLWGLSASPKTSRLLILF